MAGGEQGGRTAPPHPMPGQGVAESRSTGDKALSPAPGVAGLAAVAAAYYLGALLGAALRFPPATTSVLWPPNAILTAALLLVPPRRFWLVVLAALPAHFAAQLPAGMPLSLSAALYLTNCAEALLAAWLVHRWSDEPGRFDTLQRVLILVGAAVLLAPFLTSFADAAAVHVRRGEAFDDVFFRRLFSNILSQLVVVPSAVILVRGARRLRDMPTRTRAEVALFAITHFTVGGLVLRAYLGSFDLPGGPFTALPLLMPLLVYAAVRFGPAGASLSLLSTALLATGIAVWGTGGSGVRLAEERVLAMQVFLIVVGTPLLCLSALVEERRQAAATLRERLRFEELVSQISAAFAHVPSHEMREAFADALARLGTLMRLERAVLWKGDCAPTAPVGGPRVLSQEAIVWVEGAERASPAVLDQGWMQRIDARAILSLPLAAGDQPVGNLVLVAAARDGGWPGSEVEGARLVAGVFAGALARQQAEDKLRAAETINAAVMASLHHHVAVLDHDGRIVAVNAAWTRFTGESCTRGASGVGDDYLALCRDAEEPRPHDLREIADGIENVLAGRASSFSGEYMTSVGERWVHLSVVPLNRPEGGVVLSYADVNERRVAETQAHQLRDELAHCLRVSTVGELTSSIAHELNQPLAAILANSQAARRLLAGAGWQGRREELDEILADVSAESHRAGEVIRGVRLLVRKGASEPEEVDVNALVREVLKLAANDALIRAVALRPILGMPRVLVRGDRVQLQQVLLNLLLNALEAMPDGPGERTIAIRTEKGPAGMATVSVTDTGRGLPPGKEEALFEPFYTTKENGLGMGLSIARSIVEAHGGSITAAPGPRGGATVAFTLPLASAQSAERAQASISGR
jgi:signal transduction histidine kinase/integral membrane sensor domain MASE1